MRTPSSLWQPSPRAYDPNPPAWDYGQGAELRQVNSDGDLYLEQQKWPLAMALRLETVELKRVDQRILVFFCQTLIRQINLLDQAVPCREPLVKQTLTCKGCHDNDV
jgi:hypothetical protein